MPDAEPMTAGRNARSNPRPAAVTVLRQADPPPGPAAVHAMTAVVERTLALWPLNQDERPEPSGNAHPQGEARRREALAEVITASLSGADAREVAGLVARGARRIGGAALATVWLSDELDDLTLAAADGVHDGDPADLRVPLAGAAAVHRTGVSLCLAEARTGGWGLDLPGEVAAGPLLIVPLGATRPRGAVALVGTAASGPFGDTAQRLVETFAAQVAVALELAARRRDAERPALLEDRDRIAGELHDTVIQRLFATAMTLTGTMTITRSPDVAVRLEQAMDDLDGTIRQIRSTIFALRVAPGDGA
ncbi:histidine kinase [Actinomadura sp. GTD37]|uniref:sensor histidine kinase n=1 Tax=Actinomadura sp. GTD37 TaxID=1778030 RepID=UPI0035C17B76